MKLSKYFTYDECKCNGVNCCGNVAPMDHQFLAIADKLRELSGGPYLSIVALIIHRSEGLRRAVTWKV